MRREFVPGFVNYKKECTRLAAASDKVYQLLAHGRWFSSDTPASSTTKTGRHDIAEILLKVALNTINQSINQPIIDKMYVLQARIKGQRPFKNLVSSLATCFPSTNVDQYLYTLLVIN